MIRAWTRSRVACSVRKGWIFLMLCIANQHDCIIVAMWSLKVSGHQTFPQHSWLSWMGLLLLNLALYVLWLYGSPYIVSEVDEDDDAIRKQPTPIFLVSTSAQNFSLVCPLSSCLPLDQECWPKFDVTKSPHWLRLAPRLIPFCWFCPALQLHLGLPGPQFVLGAWIHWLHLEP